MLSPDDVADVPRDFMRLPSWMADSTGWRLGVGIRGILECGRSSREDATSKHAVTVRSPARRQMFPQRLFEPPHAMVVIPTVCAGHDNICDNLATAAACSAADTIADETWRLEELPAPNLGTYTPTIVEH